MKKIGTISGNDIIEQNDGSVTFSAGATLDGDGRKEFEIPVDRALKKKIEKKLLAHDQFLTHVDLVVGADEDFLSADFPNDASPRVKQLRNTKANPRE